MNATPNMVKAVLSTMAASSGRLSPAKEKEIRKETKKIISGKGFKIRVFLVYQQNHLYCGTFNG